MYLDHFGLAEHPFRITPHTEFFFSGANRGATLEALIYVAAHEEGIIKISGEVGSGKTMLCRVLMERLPKHVVIVYLSNPSLSREDILYAIADELMLKLPENARNNVVLKLLQTHLIDLYAEGRRVVILIDEAHAMPVETLEEIRLLSNLESNHNKLLQLILFGQPELNDILARADMRQLKERITHNFALEPLIQNDVGEYLEFRMRAAGYKGPNVFAPAATKLIYRASKGLTRRINILADKALLSAYAKGTHQITAVEVKAAIRDCDFSEATTVSLPMSNGKRFILGFLALFIVVAGSIAAFMLTGTPTSQTHAGNAPHPTSPAATNASDAQAGSLSATAAGAATLTQQALNRGQAWLTTAADDRWFLQLHNTDASESDAIEDYLRHLAVAEKDTELRPDDIRVYRSDLSGKMRYGVIYGDYPNRSAALAATTQLPDWVRATRPYPRQVKKLR